MTPLHTTPEPERLIGPAEQSVADIRAALDTLHTANAGDAVPPLATTTSDVTEHRAEYQAAAHVILNRLADGDDRSIRPGTDALAVIPDPTLARAILVLDLNDDDTAGAHSYATHDSATGTLLTGLTLDPATLAELDTPPQVTVTIEPGDRLKHTPQADTDPAAPALTDVLLAERTSTAVAYRH